MLTLLRGGLHLIYIAILTLLIPSAYATNQTTGQKEIDSGSIFSMFVIMTIIFMLF